jgi:6-phospho-3-hexuloisomerase
MSAKARPDLFDMALGELGDVLRRIDEQAIDAACKTLVPAGRIAAYGCGREALQIKGFAMRLFHLGLPVSVVGDMTAPALGKGDVFLVTSGPGETSTVLALMKIAKKAGAQNLLLTAEPDSSAAKLSGFTLHIPAQTMASDVGTKATSVLPMGSAYEGALFVLFEIMVLKLKVLIDASPEAMRARHTNME